MRDGAKQDEGFKVDKASLRHREQFVPSCTKFETLLYGTVVQHQQKVIFDKLTLLPILSSIIKE